MGKLLLLIAAFAGILFTSVYAGKSRKCPKRTLAKTVKKYEACLAKGFTPKIAGCSKTGDGVLKKKQLKKCTKFEKNLKKCDYKCVVAVDGGWSDYGDWSECSAKCGGGTKVRSMACNNPAPANGGADCAGDGVETVACNTGGCPVDGGWSDYGDWSECNAECGGGTKVRSMTCNNPAPANGGADCAGDGVETVACNTGGCPVDGGWSDYGDWSECNAVCAQGTKVRSRTCNNPAPANGGADCVGVGVETVACTGGCPAYCSGSSCYRGTINSVALAVGQSLYSDNRRYRLSMQGNGNLVIYCNNHAIWESYTSGRSVQGGLVFQADQNLVLSDATGLQLWQSNSAGGGGHRLLMQGDGNLVMYTVHSKPVWASDTSGKC